MKILHTVAEYHPAVGGMQEVVRQISERLAALGHDVTVATSKAKGRENCRLNGVSIAQFGIKGSAVSGFKGETRSYTDFLLGSQFDVVTNFAAQQWATDLMLPIIGQVRGKKVLVPTGFSGLYLPEYAQYFAQMPGYLKQYDMNVFLSDEYRDIDFARRHEVANTVLIPNGAGADEFLGEPALDLRRKLGIPAAHRLIINVGSHTGLKGHGEALAIFDAARLTDTTFLMIGNSYWNGCGKICGCKSLLLNRRRQWRQSGKRLIVMPLTRSETVAAYREADLFLFPSQIECSPIVLFECMASRTPFLTTDVGNAAEIIRWSGGGMLLPTEVTRNGFSKARVPESVPLLERLCENDALRQELAGSGFAAWQQRFTWEKITQQYERLYAELAGQLEKGITGETCSVSS